MLIYIDYEGITYASDYIFKLKNTAFEINDRLQESLGSACAAEKEVIALLSEICTTTFPEMLESSRRLLQAIATEFRKMDQYYGHTVLPGPGPGSAAGTVAGTVAKSFLTGAGTAHPGAYGTSVLGRISAGASAVAAGVVAVGTTGVGGGSR